MTLARAEQLLRDPPEWARTWTVDAVVRAVPGVGRARALRIARRAGPEPAAALGDLTAAQREAVARALMALAPPRARGEEA